MQLQHRLVRAGLARAAQALEFRSERLQKIGMAVEQTYLLTHEERAALERFENQSRAVKGVSNHEELMEFDRLAVLLSRMTAESLSWLRSLSLQRLRQMMDAIE